MDEEKENELAEALDRYTDPSHPEFDLEFSLEIMSERPDWFTTDQIVAVSAIDQP